MKKDRINVAAILTCHNRKEKTVNCVKKLAAGNPTIIFQFIIVDDGSTDGTSEELNNIKNPQLSGPGKVHILQGDGNLYWAGGMRKGMMFAKKGIRADYCLLVNDDVEFFENSIEKMINICHNNVVVGTTCDEMGQLTYGGIRYTGKGVHYNKVEIDASDKKCDTFNANCVLIPFDIFQDMPVIDNHYIHTLGDFDYGLELKRNGLKIRATDFYVGVCKLNRRIGTWEDKSLSRIERIKRKEDIKGAPFKQWFYFLKKNFGLGKAVVYGFLPYIRIMIGK